MKGSTHWMSGALAGWPVGPVGSVVVVSPVSVPEVAALVVGVSGLVVLVVLVLASSVVAGGASPQAANRQARAARGSEARRRYRNADAMLWSTGQGAS